MPLPDYVTIAKELGVYNCHGVRDDGSLCLNEVHFDPPVRTTRGSIDYVTGTIHWSARRPTRAGIYRFLLLVADLKTRRPGELYWQHRYRTLRMLPELAKDVRVMLPRQLGSRDRMALKAMLVSLPSSPLRDEAMEWANRK